MNRWFSRFFFFLSPIERKQIGFAWADWVLIKYSLSQSLLDICFLFQLSALDRLIIYFSDLRLLSRSIIFIVCPIDVRNKFNEKLFQRKRKKNCFEHKYNCFVAKIWNGIRFNTSIVSIGIIELPATNKKQDIWKWCHFEWIFGFDCGRYPLVDLYRRLNTSFNFEFDIECIAGGEITFSFWRRDTVFYSVRCFRIIHCTQVNLCDLFSVKIFNVDKWHSIVFVWPMKCCRLASKPKKLSQTFLFFVISCRR